MTVFWNVEIYQGQYELRETVVGMVIVFMVM